MFNINNILKSSVVVFFLALGAFLYSGLSAAPVTGTCPVCSGRFGEPRDCVQVNLGGSSICIVTSDDCFTLGEDCDEETGDGDD